MLPVEVSHTYLFGASKKTRNVVTPVLFPTPLKKSTKSCQLPTCRNTSTIVTCELLQNCNMLYFTVLWPTYVS